METIDDKAVATTEVDNVETTDGKGVVKTKASATIEEATIVVVANVETIEEATTEGDRVGTTDGKGVVISEISERIVEEIANPA